MSKQTLTDQPNVAHNFLYHVEIQYETERAFDYTKAVGNTIQELMADVNTRLKQYKDREPKIVKALYLPNSKEKVNITAKILSLIAMKPAYSS